MFIGPMVQLDWIMAILLTLRIGAVAITTVKQMFRQIWINPAQRDYPKIVWRFSENKPIADYLLKSVTFRVVSSYLAIYCILWLAGKEAYPLTSAALQSSIYIDNLIIKVFAVGESYELRKQLYRYSVAQVSNKEWASSYAPVLTNLAPELCNCSLLSFESIKDESLKILRLH
ncbi:uncharacterized protein LOC105832533 [Monomorium pharaonis]|uniref:uncharacterized protein LOC105832533 n=1 Tax=Monomorium pharaonis TaxID=307658 RepID=UPI00174634A7|nr:uncharacterized protein LOC105832533 [Monomorium pharaonis]